MQICSSYRTKCSMFEVVALSIGLPNPNEDLLEALIRQIANNV